MGKRPWRKPADCDAAVRGAAHGPTTLAAVTMTITLVAAGAYWVPAWRPSQLDPNVVLRTD
jgi:hypothetical protein